MSRPIAPASERPVDGETQREAQARRDRNRASRKWWAHHLSERCAICGMARANVVHESDPATAPEGPDYYADFLDELHEFVPATP